MKGIWILYRGDPNTRKFWTPCFLCLIIRWSGIHMPVLIKFNIWKLVWYSGHGTQGWFSVNLLNTGPVFRWHLKIGPFYIWDNWLDPHCILKWIFLQLVLLTYTITADQNLKWTQGWPLGASLMTSRRTRGLTLETLWGFSDMGSLGV